ncbi:MAG: hypothetical protein ACI4PF_01315, partial [Christensenellales bacterium]
TYSSYRHYLPVGEFTDQFDNLYSDDLMLENALSELKELNNLYVYKTLSNTSNRFNQAVVDEENSGKLYIGTPYIGSSSEETYTDTFTCVSTVSDIVNATAVAQIKSRAVQTTYKVYPEIDIALTLKEDGIDNGAYIVRTFGGRYAVNMLENGKIKFANIINLYQNEVDEANIVENGVINFLGSRTKQFAYWEVWGENTGISGETLLFNVANTSYYTTNEIIIDSHYNVKLTASSVDNKGNGSVTIKDANGNTVGLNNLSVTIGNINAEPSKVYLSDTGLGVGDDDIQLKHIAIIKDGFEFIVKDVNSGLIGYTGTYTKDASETRDISVVWKVNFANYSKVFYLIEDNDSCTIEDDWGEVTVSPLIFSPSVEIIYETNLFITNVNSNYQSTYGSLISLTGRLGMSSTIEGGSIMLTDDNITFTYSSSSSWSTKLYFRPLGNEEDKSTLYYIQATSSGSSTDLSTLSKYTENYRWQYYYDNKWNDVEAGNSLADCNGNTGQMKVRLVCDWKTYNVNLMTFGTLSSNNLTSTKFNGFDVTYALNYLSGSFQVNKDSSITNNVKSITYTMLMGDSVTYDLENETITLTSTGNKDFSQIIIKYPLSTAYNQGWFNLAQSGGKYSISNIGSNLKDKDFTFAIWLEEKTTKSIKVDKYEYENVINGYGNVIVFARNVKSDQQLSAGLADEGKDGYYVKDHTMGASTILEITANINGNSPYFHNFVNMFYYEKNKDTYTTHTESYLKITAGILKTDINILYDASSTKTQYVITDELLNVKYLTDIYGGYSIEYNCNNSIKTITIYDMFGIEADKLYVDSSPNTNNVVSSYPYIYPRYNFRIDNLYIARSTMDFTFNINTITNNSNINNYTLPSSYTNAITTSKYIHKDTDASTNNNILVFMDESLYQVDLNIMISVQAGNSTSYENGLNTKFATMDANILVSGNYSKSTTIVNSKISKLIISNLKSNSTLGMYYDISAGRDGMMLGIYESGNTALDLTIFRNNADYNLLGLSLYNKLDGSITSGDTALLNSNYYNSSESSGLVGSVSKLEKLEVAEYTLVIRLEEPTESNVSFLLTLPYESDLLNLNMSSTLLTGIMQNGVRQPSELKTVEDTGTKYESYAVQNYAKGFICSDNGTPIVFNMLSGKSDSVNNSNLINSSEASTGIINTPSLVIPRDSYVKIYGSELYFYNSNNESIGKISYTRPAIYDYLGTATGNMGWY